MDSEIHSGHPGQFPSTCWSRVVAAGDPDDPGAAEALEALCRAYWYPIYAFIRARGHGADAAPDLTQGFFARLLERGLPGRADAARGRFRAFLKADCGFFLADLGDRERAARRGGGRPPLSLDARSAEGRYLREPADAMTPDRLFDRAWALGLLAGVLDRLEAEQEEGGRSALFQDLRPTLTGGDAAPYAGIARRHGLTESAVQQAAHRLRKRYGAILREEIASTLDDPSAPAIADEIRSLFAALAP